MIRLPDAEHSFVMAAAGQLPPHLRSSFADRVAAIVGAHPDPGPGDFDRAIRSVLLELRDAADTLRRAAALEPLSLPREQRGSLCYHFCYRTR
jgi:hypothetical protein